MKVREPMKITLFFKISNVILLADNHARNWTGAQIYFYYYHVILNHPLLSSLLETIHSKLHEFLCGEETHVSRQGHASVLYRLSHFSKMIKIRLLRRTFHTLLYRDIKTT